MSGRDPMDLEEIRVRVNADVSSLISTMLRLCDEVERLQARVATAWEREDRQRNA